MSRTYVPVELRLRIQEQGRRRCGYCLTQEKLTGTPMEVEHIIPEAEGGLTTEENLWLACTRCNEHKGARLWAVDPFTQQVVPLFDPRRQAWAEHFCWNDDGDVVIGLTPTGRATAYALQLNRVPLIHSRRVWVSWRCHPPTDEPTGARAARQENFAQRRSRSAARRILADGTGDVPAPPTNTRAEGQPC